MSNSKLDQFAEAIAQARAAGSFGNAEPAEQQLLDVLLDIAPELDHTTVGAAWLVIGNLFRSNLEQAPPHQQGDAAVNLMNLVQLAGQRLYAGAPLTHPCPIPRSNGTACRFTAKGARQEVLDAMMRAHVAVYHPGQSWPPEPDEPDGDDLLLRIPCGNCGHHRAYHREHQGRNHGCEANAAHPSPGGGTRYGPCGCGSFVAPTTDAQP
jgi:hypothetical protein